jgi:hypothetical protein
VAESRVRHAPFDTAMTAASRLIFQFMARALQTTNSGLLNFAEMPVKRGWNPFLSA